MLRRFRVLVSLDNPYCVSLYHSSDLKARGNLWSVSVCIVFSIFKRCVEWTQQWPRLMFIHCQWDISPIFHEIKSLIWLNRHFYGWNKLQSFFVYVCVCTMETNFILKRFCSFAAIATIIIVISYVYRLSQSYRTNTFFSVFVTMLNDIEMWEIPSNQSFGLGIGVWQQPILTRMWKLVDVVGQNE